MPPMHLRHGRQYYLGYCTDMRTEESGNIGNPSLYRRHTCEVTRFQLRRYAGGKALRWFYLPSVAKCRGSWVGVVGRRCG